MELFSSWDSNMLDKVSTALRSLATANTEHTNVPIKKSNNYFFILNKGTSDYISAATLPLISEELRYTFMRDFIKLSLELSLKFSMRYSKNLSLSI